MNVKQLDDALYSLKKEFGVCFELFDVTNVQVNQATGYKKVESDLYIIEGFTLPRSMTREFFNNFASRKGSNNFSYGGYDDTIEAVIIVRTDDLPPNFTTNLTYEAVHNGKRYSTVEINEVVDGLVVSFTFKTVQGQTSYNVIQRQVKENVEIQELGGN